MNAIVAQQQSHPDVIDVLCNSLYPGAKRESVELVLSYCRVNGIDPMLKAVHIVPTWIKGRDGQGGEMRDVLMPGIADYRIKAARSGEYVGKSEPEFGPDITDTMGGVEITYPRWCRMTIKRRVGGAVCDFTAKEYWIENYATAKRDSVAPNAMWKRRAYGQLAKCAEAQALRMAFPEFSGGQVTAEEMEGKTIEGSVDLTPRSQPRPLPIRNVAPIDDMIPALEQPKVNDPLVNLRKTLAACTERPGVARIEAAWNQFLAKNEKQGNAAPPTMRLVADKMIADAYALFPEPASDASEDMDGAAEPVEQAA